KDAAGSRRNPASPVIVDFGHASQTVETSSVHVASRSADHAASGPRPGEYGSHAENGRRLSHPPTPCRDEADGNTFGRLVVCQTSRRSQHICHHTLEIVQPTVGLRVGLVATAMTCLSAILASQAWHAHRMLAVSFPLSARVVFHDTARSRDCDCSRLFRRS